MYHSPLRYGFGGAGARYTSIDLDARVEGATPHQLIAILFEELLKAVDAMRVAHRQGDRARMGSPQSRATSILLGLEGSLDHEKGADVAANLGKIYRQARRLVAGAGGDHGQELDRARQMLGEIAGAWLSIG